MENQPDRKCLPNPPTTILAPIMLNVCLRTVSPSPETRRNVTIRVRNTPKTRAHHPRRAVASKSSNSKKPIINTHGTSNDVFSAADKPTKKKRERDIKVTKQDSKHTAAGIPTWSPTVVLICRSTAYVWQSGRDAQFSADCGRTCCDVDLVALYT